MNSLSCLAIFQLCVTSSKRLFNSTRWTEFLSFINNLSFGNSSKVLRKNLLNVPHFGSALSAPHVHNPKQPTHLGLFQRCCFVQLHVFLLLFLRAHVNPTITTRVRARFSPLLIVHVREGRVVSRSVGLRPATSSAARAEENTLIRSSLGPNCIYTGNNVFNVLSRAHLLARS